MIEQTHIQKRTDESRTSTHATGGSSYENYDDAFRRYDATRIPVGVSELCTAFEQCGKPLSTLHIFDGGFGTGSYLAAFAEMAAVVSGVEPTKTGYEAAMQKLSERGLLDKVGHLSRGSLFHLHEFDNGCIDGCMVNQVLHHIDSLAGVRLALEELARITREDGVVTVQTCSAAQLRHNDGPLLHYRFFSEERADWIAKERYMPLESLSAIAEEVGLELIASVAPKGTYYTEKYYDPEYLKTDTFLASSSSCAGMSDAEKDAYRSSIDRAVAEKRFPEMAADAQERLREIGCATLLVFSAS